MPENLEINDTTNATKNDLMPSQCENIGSVNGIIYKTTNAINGRFYIGKDRHNDPHYLGSGLLLRKAINKYGKNNFKKDILEHCKTLKELNEKEIYWIEKLGATKRNVGYNIAKGGMGGDTLSCIPTNRKREIFRKISAARKETIANNPELEILRGNHISESKRGCIFSESHKKNLSVSHIGQSAWNKGKKCSILSEAKKIRINKNVVDMIIELYEKLSPRSIAKVLIEMKILSVSDIVIRRILNENGISIKNDNMFRGGMGRIIHKNAVSIARPIINRLDSIEKIE